MTGGSNHKLIVALLFALFLLVGLSVYRDYGLSWDEEWNRERGLYTFNYVAYADKFLFSHRDKEYGTALELPLILVEKAMGWEYPQDSRDIYLMRHLCTFLLFYVSVFFFYLLCEHHFSSWRMGLLGSLFLILSPRIFADSFYNSKDLAFMSFFIIAMYTLVKYLERKTLLRASIHALACALATDMRIAGVLVPFLTLFFAIMDLTLSRRRENSSTVLKSLLVYSTLCVFLTVLFWPYLWPDPLHNFINAFERAIKTPGDHAVTYFGGAVNSIDLPWHYIPVWIAITTPPLYFLAFLVGIAASVVSFVKNRLNFYASNNESLIFMFCFFLPISAVIANKVLLYNGWRHMFFIYPSFLIISLEGLSFLFETAKSKLKKEYPIHLGKRVVLRVTASSVLIIIVALSLANTAKFMAENHPYQNIYFNALAGRSMTEVQKKFDMDYWGLSYRRALEYILENDNEKTMNISVINFPGRFNALILTPEERARLTYVENPEDARYYLTLDGNKNGCPKCNEEFYAIKVNGAKIMVVYKLQ